MPIIPPAMSFLLASAIVAEDALAAGLVTFHAYEPRIDRLAANHDDVGLGALAGAAGAGIQATSPDVSLRMASAITCRGGYTLSVQ